MKKYEQLAIFLEDNARGPDDNEAASVLRNLGSIYEAAYEVVWAKNREHQNAAYRALEGLIKGKTNE